MTTIHTCDDITITDGKVYSNNERVTYFRNAQSKKGRYEQAKSQFNKMDSHLRKKRILTAVAVTAVAVVSFIYFKKSVKPTV